MQCAAGLSPRWVVWFDVSEERFASVFRVTEFSFAWKEFSHPEDGDGTLIWGAEKNVNVHVVITRKTITGPYLCSIWNDLGYEFLRGCEIFLSSELFRPPTKPPVHWRRGFLPGEVPHPGCEADHHHPLPMLRMSGSVPYFPFFYLYDAHRDSFAFSFSTWYCRG